MSKLAHWNILGVTAALIVSATISLNLAIAQPKPTAKAAKADPAATEAEAPEKKVRAKANPKGRLPAYYKDIVDEKQKAKIYEIQADFNAKIDALEEQLAKLAADRDNAVEGLLTPEQKDKLKKAKDEAAAKRKKPAKEGDKPAAPAE
jgi:hypothetical protein